MSIAMMELVWNYSKQSGSALLLLLRMADHANNAGEGIFPSIARLAKAARVNERQAQYILRRLEASGEIVRVTEGSGRGHPNHWRIVREKMQPTAPILERVQSDIQKGCNPASERVQPTAPDPKRSVIDPSERGRARAKRIDPEMILSGKMVEMALRHGVGDPEAEFEHFKAHHRARGDTMVNWEQAWLTWCIKPFPKANGKSAQSNEAPWMAGLKRFVEGGNGPTADRDAFVVGEGELDQAADERPSTRGMAGSSSRGRLPSGVQRR